MWGDKYFPAAEWSVEKLLHLFNSQGGPKPRGTSQSYPEILELLLTGTIKSMDLNIQPTKRPLSPPKGGHFDKDWAIFKNCRHGGGDLHGWLKWWAYKWIESQAEAPPKLECTIRGYGRADLFSPESKTIVECGNTSPSHVIRFLEMATGNRFILIPFQRGAIANTGALCLTPLKAFAFSQTSTRSPTALVQH